MFVEITGIHRTDKDINSYRRTLKKIQYKHPASDISLT